jgi:ParB family transcriptional regulator, chromosome partitioning protein
MSRAALGKGLGALIRETETPLPAPPPAPAPPQTDGTRQIDIDLIDPSPYQPRTRFDEAALEELAQSIRATGVIQPLIVRPRGSRFQLVAGERRWRASQRAGLHRVPALVRDVSEEKALEMTLVENLQREDLSPIEQAKAYQRLIDDFHLTQEEVAERTGKDRASVANAVRLLRLEMQIQEMIDTGRLSAGHGRALLAVADAGLRLQLAQRAARGRMNVRQIERIAAGRKRAKNSADSDGGELDPNVKAAIEELQRVLATRVTLRPCAGKKPGQLVIEYYDDGQLIGLYERIVR